MAMTPRERAEQALLAWLLREDLETLGEGKWDSVVDQITSAIAEAVAEERAACLSYIRGGWLRTIGAVFNGPADVRVLLDDIADAIDARSK